MKFFLEVEIPDTTIAMEDLFSYVRINQQHGRPVVNGTPIAFTGKVRDAELYEVTKESEYIKRSK